MDLDKILIEIVETEFYNINDEKKKPLKIKSLGLAKGHLFSAGCEQLDGKIIYIDTCYLKSLINKSINLKDKL